MTGLELTLAAALLAPAQLETTVGVQQDAANHLTVVLGQANRRPADEQVEVMRALLLRKLGRDVAAQGTYGWMSPTVQGYVGAKSADATLYDPVGYAPALAGTLSNVYRAGWSHGAAVEGTYLEGYGAVFTVTMDVAARDPRPKADGEKAAAALTEWERTQRALRGEAVPERPSTAAKELPLGDVLLKLLADNGKHFSALKDDERLTVAVTFRGAASQNLLSRSAQSAAVAQYYPPSAMTRDDKALDLLGEMHLKQGEPQKAIDTYLKALAQAESAAREAPDAADGKDRVQGALLRLAQAYLAAGKIDEARETMDKAKSAREKGTATTKPATKLVPTPPPARLTVSAPKKLLDQVGSGKMSFDEFRKQASVEYTGAGK